MDERRQNIRLNRNIEISYRIPKQLFKSGSRSVNISIGGLCFPTIHKLKPGMILDLEVRSIEIGKPIVATGEVVWVNKKEDEKFPFEVGLKFIKITPSDLKALNYIFEIFKERKPENIKWID